MESNRQPAAEEKVRAILTALRRTDLPSAPSDLLYGLPGLLYTSRFLRSHSLQLPQQVIQSAFDACIQEGLRTARSGEFRTLGMRMGLRSFPPLFWRFFGKSYLGAAHGLAGVLCELLHHPRLLETPASRYSDSPEVAESSIGDLVLQTIQWLVPFADPNLPSSLDSMGTDLVQWCHGSPGFAVLLEKAIQVFGGEGFQDPLQTCGEVVWEKGLLTKGVGGLLSINELLLLSQRRTFPGLCHGISGNAYTFLALLRTSIHPQQNLNRAIQFAIFARDWQKLTEEGTLRHPDHMYSLFEGAAGYLCLLVELLKISERKESLGFPCQADVGDAEGVEQVALGT